MLPLVSTMPTSFVAVSLKGVECGSYTCKLLEYCSDHTSDCEKCSDICDASHNYDQHLCETKCQHFLQNRSFNEMFTKYDSEIQNLKVFLIITFILTLILLILFFTVNGAKLFRLLKKLKISLSRPKKSEKQIEPVGAVVENPNTESPKMRKNPRLAQFQLNRASSVFTVTGSEFDQKTVSTPISRHPAEDTLTTVNTSSTSNNDFSYENRGLQLTPTDKAKTETNF